MTGDFGIGLGLEADTARLKLFFERMIVFDDSVMDQNYPPRLMGMSIRLGRLAMGGPTGMPDSHGTAGMMVADARDQFGEFSLSAPDAHMMIGEDRNAGGIVAAVFKPFQALEKNRGHIPVTDVADDPAHVCFNIE